MPFNKRHAHLDPCSCKHSWMHTAPNTNQLSDFSTTWSDYNMFSPLFTALLDNHDSILHHRNSGTSGHSDIHSSGTSSSMTGASVDTARTSATHVTNTTPTTTTTNVEIRRRSSLPIPGTSHLQRLWTKLESDYKSIPWDRLKSIKWKNDRAKPGCAYRPTEVSFTLRLLQFEVHVP